MLTVNCILQPSGTNNSDIYMISSDNNESPHANIHVITEPLSLPGGLIVDNMDTFVTQI